MAQSGDVVFDVLILHPDELLADPTTVSTCTTEEIAEATRDAAMRRYGLPPEQVAIEKRKLDVPIWFDPAMA